MMLIILVCAAARLFCACLFSDQVSATCDIAGNTQELYTCLYYRTPVYITVLLRPPNTCGPTIQLPGMNLPCGQWSLLNRFRTDAGPCRNSRPIHEWGCITSPLCDYREHQTMRHIVNECPLICFDGGIFESKQIDV